MAGFKIIEKIETRKCETEMGDAKEHPFAPFLRPPLRLEDAASSYQASHSPGLQGFLDMGEKKTTPAWAKPRVPLQTLSATYQILSRKGDSHSPATDASTGWDASSSEGVRRNGKVSSGKRFVRAAGDGDSKAPPSKQLSDATLTTASLAGHEGEGGGTPRHFELHPGQVPNLTISPFAGGFPSITHGGLVGYMGYRALAEIMGENAGGPAQLRVRLSQPLVPGRHYLAESQGDSRKASVEFRESDGSPALATVGWEPLADPLGATGAPVDVQGLEAGKSGDFQCIGSCVAFGAENPEGLHLTARYRLGKNGKADQLWTILDAASGTSLREQLIAADELGWWMGAASTNEVGVTVKYDFKTQRPESREDQVIVLVNRPERVRKITEIPISFLTSGGELLAHARISYRPSAETAEAGMAGATGEHLLTILGRLGGVKGSSSDF